MVYKRNKKSLSVFLLYLVQSKNPEAIVLKTRVIKGIPIQCSSPTGNMSYSPSSVIDQY